MSVFTMEFENDERFFINRRPDEHPVVSVEVPMDHFFKLFPKAAEFIGGRKLIRVVEALYDDELTAIINEVSNKRLS